MIEEDFNLQWKRKNALKCHMRMSLFLMTVITAILANIIPAGTFDRVEDASGNSVVVADSFHHVDKIGCSIFDMFKSFQIGFEDSAQIISLSSLHMHLYMYF